MSCGKHHVCAKVAHVLVVIGALNWLLVGLSGFFAKGETPWDLVQWILGSVSYGPSVVYTLVGLAGVQMLWMCISGHCSVCKDTKEGSK